MTLKDLINYLANSKEIEENKLENIVMNSDFAILGNGGYIYDVRSIMIDTALNKIIFSLEPNSDSIERE